MRTRQRHGRAVRRARRPANSVRARDEVLITLRAPVSPEKIERWVEDQVDRLREEARATGVRLGRLAPGSHPQGADWLIEVDLQDRDVELEHDAELALILTHMAVLGLRPQLLVTSPRDAPEVARPVRHSAVPAWQSFS